ncbi:MAG: integrase arm-type DNA-binding domain-containing protein [Deltaproteobacteria bacterium]|jgi:integrase|nr:integrase arm-type DNA-binding domain-containing protein [Deltaproteobacteria bacterium]
MLTDVCIKKAETREKAYKLYDGSGNGLYLEVAPTGSRLWRVQYAVNGKRTLKSLGAWPDVSIREAREQAAALRKAVAKGADPRQGRSKAPLFKEVAAAWAERYFPTVVPGVQQATRKYLDVDILPAIGDCRPDEIKPPLVLEKVLRPVEATGHLSTLSRIKSVLSRIFCYAVANGLMERDFTLDLRKAFQAPQVVHRAALTDPVKVGQLLRDIDGYSGPPLIGFALKLSPYVFVRASELCNAKWEEISLAEAVWRIPAARMKMGTAHAVPLASQAVKILEELRKLTGSGLLLFPGQRDKFKGLNYNSLTFALRQLGYGAKEACAHGFRTTASTLLNELGYPVDWIELQLAHRPRGVRAVYNRAEHLQERAKMMQEWADYLDSLREGGPASS